MAHVDETQHPDEGTIHAWLDGAMSAADGERLQAHIASCSACSAAVAEARGLIAASSRILSALDEIPGGVIPAAPTSRAPAAPVARRRPPWFLRPQFAAAAGIAFVALTATWVTRRSPDRSVADFARDRAAETSATSTESPVAATDSAPMAAGRVAAAEAPVAAAPAAPALAAERDAKPKKATVARDELRAGPPPPAPSPPAPSAAANVSAATTGASAVNAAPTATPARADSSTAARADTSAAAERRLSLDPTTVVSAEKARVAGEAEAQRRRPSLTDQSIRLEQVVTTGAAQAAPRAEGGRAQPTLATGASPEVRALAGCYLLPRNDAVQRSGGGERWALEPTAQSPVDGRSTYLARALDVAVRGSWRWSTTADGGLVLLHLADAGGAVTRFPVEVEGAAPAGARAAASALRLTRIDCPPR